MTQASMVRAKSRFRVMYRVVAVGGVEVQERPWRDYAGKSMTYMVACEEVEKLRSDATLGGTEYAFKVMYEGLMRKENMR